MNVARRTMDLIDELADRGLRPQAYSGRFMHGAECVAVVLSRDSGYAVEDMPREGRIWDHLGLGLIVYWPSHPWDESVAEYVSTIFDEE